MHCNDTGFVIFNLCPKTLYLRKRSHEEDRLRSKYQANFLAMAFKIALKPLTCDHEV